MYLILFILDHISAWRNYWFSVGAKMALKQGFSDVEEMKVFSQPFRLGRKAG